MRRDSQGQSPATIDVVVAVAAAVVVVGSEGETDMILVLAASSDHCPDGYYVKIVLNINRAEFAVS